MSTAPAYLVKGIIPRHGIVIVWGPPKCGKSFWISDLTLHVALGWQYRDCQTSGGAIVYCAFEGAIGFKTRIEAFRRKHNVARETDAPFFLSATRINLIKDHRALIASISAQLDTVRPVAVVLDTLNRSLDGSENKPEDMAAYVSAADAIREAFDCVVIIVHHCGIDGSRPRGHTSITGTADAQLAVQRDAAGNIIVTVEWMKDGPEGAVIASKLDVVTVGTDDDGDDITSCVVTAVAGDAIQASRKKVTGQAKIALDRLRQALTQLYQFALPRDDFAGAHADKCESNQWSALANRL